MNNQSEKNSASASASASSPASVPVPVPAPGNSDIPLHSDVAAGRVRSPRLPRSCSPALNNGSSDTSLHLDEDIVMSEILSTSSLSSSSLSVSESYAATTNLDAQIDKFLSSINEFDESSTMFNDLQKVQSNTSMLRDKRKLLNEQMINATSVDEVSLLKAKLDAVSSQINACQKELCTLKHEVSKYGNKKQRSLSDSSANERRKLVPIKLIPIFHITNIEDTIVYHNNADNAKLDNSSSPPTLEAFFNTFESVYAHHITTIPIGNNWQSTLRMSFTPCSEIIYHWYKKE